MNQCALALARKWFTIESFYYSQYASHPRYVFVSFHSAGAFLKKKCFITRAHNVMIYLTACLYELKIFRCKHIPAERNDNDGIRNGNLYVILIMVKNPA